MKKIKSLVALCLVMLMIFTVTGCKKVVTYPDAVYSDIYSDIVIGGDGGYGIDDDDYVVDSTGSEGTSTNDYLVDDVYDYNMDDEKTKDFGGIDISGGKAFNVADFGAKGDGKTDDFTAIYKTVENAVKYIKANPSKRAEIRFQKNKTYVISQKIPIESAKNISLIGDNTTVIGNPNDQYIKIDKSEEIVVKGFNFTYKYPTSYTAKAVEVNGGKAVFEVPKWFTDCARKNVTLKSGHFGVEADGLRNHAYISAYRVIDDTHCEVTFTSNPPELGDLYYVPTPGYSHLSTAFQISHNTGTVTLENVNIWNSSSFVFHATNNKGKLNFYNVKLVPKDSSSSATVSWRDVLHAKDNRQSITVDRCVFKGAQDDVFNIANTWCQVTEMGDDNDIKLYGLDYDGSCPTIMEGDTVVAIDPYVGTYYGEAKVVEVIAKNHIRLDRDMGFEGGEYVCFKELAAPGTKITNSQFVGTYRFKAAVTVENCDFNVLTMWIAYSGQNSRVEGPIPENITFNNCSFVATELRKGSRLFNLTCETIAGDPETEYHVKNIAFNGCSFSEGIIDKTNPYITIR